MQLSCQMDFGNGLACGGFGYRIDEEFIVSFTKVFGTDSFNHCNGHACWGVFREEKYAHLGGGASDIMRLEPLFAQDGLTFDIKLWKETRK